MFLKQLQSFVLVYQTGSMVQAARQLFISQPAISQQIKKLENELNAALFIHNKGRITPTEYADVFYPYATRAVAELEAGQEALREKTKEATSLTVHIYSYNTVTHIALFLEKYCREHPEMSINLQQSRSPKQFHTSRFFDKNTLYFADEKWIEGTQLCFTRLYDAHLLCLMRPDSPLAEKKKIEAADLIHETLYVPATPSLTLLPVFEQLSKFVPKENLRRSGGFLESTMNISAFGGMCIVPDYLSAPGGLIAVPYAPSFSFAVGFAYNGSLTPPMNQFLQEAKAYYAQQAAM